MKKKSLQEKANILLEKVELFTDTFSKNKKQKNKIIKKIIDILRPIFRESIAKSLIFIGITVLLFLFHGLNYSFLKRNYIDQNLYEYINIALFTIFILFILVLYYRSPSKGYNQNIIKAIENVSIEVKDFIENKIEAEYLYKILKDRQNIKSQLNGLSAVFIFILLIFCNLFASTFKETDISTYMLGWMMIFSIIVGVLNIFGTYRNFIYKIAIAVIQQIIYEFEIK